MQYLGDSIAPALFDKFDEQEEKVEEPFLENDVVNALEGLIESKQNAEQISPEDLAWADSCFAADTEFSFERWASIKDALLDSITAFATSYEEYNVTGIDEDEARNDEHMELDEGPEIVNDQRDIAHVQTTENSTEGDRDSDDDGEVEIASTKKELRKSIFKVWNLQEEEDNELISELKRSAAENNVVGIDENKAGYGENIKLNKEPEIVNDQRDTAYVRTRGNVIEGDHDTDDDGEIELVVVKNDFESRDSIFKVWDLREEEDNEPISELKRLVADFQLVEEEDDWFITELKRAIAESIIRDKQRLPIDEVDIAEDGKLNELISSMGDLSLKPLS